MQTVSVVEMDIVYKTSDLEDERLYQPLVLTIYLRSSMNKQCHVVCSSQSDCHRPLLEKKTLE